MEYWILAAAAVLFLGAVLSAVITRKELVRYTSELSNCLDEMIAGNEDIVFQEEQETLIGKLQTKLRKLYEILQERASQSQENRELLEKTIADLSHQVKTPISSIRMYHNFLHKENLDEKKRRQFMEALENQVDKLEFLIQSMIKLSRLESGIVRVNPEYAPVYPLLESSICDIALKAEAKEIDISVDCVENLHAFFDTKWTQEAVFNLMDNAVKYTGKGGSIQISAMATDFFVRIRIRDSGKGICEKNLTQIFKRFYREPEVTGTEGVGIGLYLAREIVDKENGFIEVQSEVGKGSVFSVHLPMEKV